MKQYSTLLVVLILAGCSSMNIPPKINTPSFQKKGQAEVELGTSTNSIYQNIGYALSDKLSIISTGFISYDFLDRNDYEKFRWSGVYFEYLPLPYENKYIDFALGLYEFDNETLKSIYIGTGIGKSNYRYKYSSDGYQEYVRNNSYNIFFSQINYGKHKGNLDYGLATRISYNLYPFKSETLNKNPINKDISANNTYHIFGIQPCFYFNINSNCLTYSLNAGIFLTNHNKGSDWFIRDTPQNTLIHLSVGLKYKIGKE